MKNQEGYSVKIGMFYKLTVITFEWMRIFQCGFLQNNPVFMFCHHPKYSEYFNFPGIRPLRKTNWNCANKIIRYYRYAWRGLKLKICFSI